jgi:hypothetical protein
VLHGEMLLFFKEMFFMGTNVLNCSLRFYFFRNMVVFFREMFVLF